MSFKEILQIKSTGELCVDEGATIIGNSQGEIQGLKHIRIIDPETYELTSITRDVNPNDLRTHKV